MSIGAACDGNATESPASITALRGLTAQGDGPIVVVGLGAWTSLGFEPALLS